VADVAAGVRAVGEDGPAVVRDQVNVRGAAVVVPDEEGVEGGNAGGVGGLHAAEGGVVLLRGVDVLVDTECMLPPRWRQEKEEKKQRCGKTHEIGSISLVPVPRSHDARVDARSIGLPSIDI